MSSPFRKAEKRQAKARLLIEGPSGSGKTWTGLQTAAVLAEGGPVAVIDSEQGSASLYGDVFDFDVMEIAAPFSPEKYVEAITAAAKAGYPVVLIDSLTHAWAGTGGVLDMVDKAKVRFNNNTQRAWSVGTPAWQSLVDAMLQTPIHVVVTLRSKTRYVEETDDRGKVKGYKKAGAEPVARDGIEYEFTLTAALDLDHNMVVGKSRCPLVPPNTVLRQPKGDLAEAMLEWLNSGAAPVDPAPPVDPHPSTEGSVASGRARMLVKEFGEAAVVESMKAAGIRSAALADDATWERAKAIVSEASKRADELPPTPHPAEPEPTGEVIAEKNRRALLAHASEHGMDKDAVKDLARELFGVESTTLIPASQVQALRDAIETHAKQQEAA